ncbi:hypothetical protein AOL_s00054g282 [Orbilia oligospora ATCC 24927]|uniref:Uncharacterized protein n=1 Tax=Arthrobotrys oligospora (strain ATCC 24927 / CBS 115.81 / DSM 1491) TaxID=756982 RepID=G1X5Y8_ARTOA|nr:hypothetical protein AOL_s00054g282 [Orbilia oligospora ATCC 24927]EGX51583.1 hypothetical protein AOL_s00054g282 [Orbilia oligospora ATCC 24927]
MVTSVGAVNPIQEWSIEYKPYWFDTIKLLKSPISGILRIMDDYYIDTEYCPISEKEDVLGTGESLERYGIILQRILPMFNETLPDISQNGSEIDLRVWKEVGETISAYLQVLERLYPEMASAGLWLARIPSYNYAGNSFETQEQALLCLIVNCTYYDKSEKPLQKDEIEARYTVRFDEGAQQKFVDAVEEIWVKFELHLNIIDSLAALNPPLQLTYSTRLNYIPTPQEAVRDMCHWKYFHNCKKTLNKWEKLTPGPFGDCKCNEEAELIEVKTCVASCVLTRGYKPCDPQKDDIPPEAHTRNELKEAVRDYKDGKIRATDLVKTFLGWLGR